jgi:hypothetical protein
MTKSKKIIFGSILTLVIVGVGLLTTSIPKRVWNKLNPKAAPVATNAPVSTPIVTTPSVPADNVDINKVKEQDPPKAIEPVKDPGTTPAPTNAKASVTITRYNLDGDNIVRVRALVIGIKVAIVQLLLLTALPRIRLIRLFLIN